MLGLASVPFGGAMRETGWMVERFESLSGPPLHWLVVEIPAIGPVSVCLPRLPVGFLNVVGHLRFGAEGHVVCDPCRGFLEEKRRLYYATRVINRDRNETKSGFNRIKEVRHTCRAYGCDKVTPPRLLMCSRHWHMVPDKLKKRVWSAYDPGQEITGSPAVEYIAAATAAILAVAAAEGLLAERQRHLWSQGELFGKGA